MINSALITGASKGIGEAIVKDLWVNHHEIETLILVARKSTNFNDLLMWLKKNNPRNKAYKNFFVDLSNRRDMLGLVENIQATNINIDLLINNAGYTKPDPIHQISLGDFDRTFNVNLFAPFVLTQGLLHKGNGFQIIINIASTAGLSGRPGWLAYSASKAALINMSEVMREELRLYGTRVVCLAPGRCATDLRKKLAPDEDPSTIMQPEHVASVVSFLITEGGRYIDSQNLVVRL